MDPIYQELISFLEAAGIPFTMHAHEPIQTVAEAREKWPGSLDRLVKTVAFRQTGGGVSLAAVRPSDRIAYAKLARLLGISRRSLHPLSAVEVWEALGVPPGGVFPLPLFPAVTQIVLDRQVAALPVILCGSGRLDRTLELQTAHLLNMAGGMVAEIAR